jgi:Chibby family
MFLTGFLSEVAMPFGLQLTNKFSPKKGTPRKSISLSNLNLDASTRTTEFGVDYGPIKLKLGSNEMLFDGGEWISGLFLA